LNSINHHAGANRNQQDVGGDAPLPRLHRLSPSLPSRSDRSASAAPQGNKADSKTTSMRLSGDTVTGDNWISTEIIIFPQ
jgi:hypothetical protein